MLKYLLIYLSTIVSTWCLGMDDAPIQGLGIESHLLENQFKLIKNGDKLRRDKNRRIACEVSENNIAFLEQFSNRSVLHSFNSWTWFEEKSIPFDSKLEKIIDHANSQVLQEQIVIENERLFRKYDHLTKHKDEIKELIEIGDAHVFIIWNETSKQSLPVIANNTQMNKSLNMDNFGIEYVKLPNGKVVVISQCPCRPQYQALFIITQQHGR